MIRSRFKQIALKNEQFTVSLLFPILGPRANHSYHSSFSHSLQKSGHKQIALIALYKRVTMSDLLKSLMTKELRECDLLFFTSESLFCLQNTVIGSKNR